MILNVMMNIFVVKYDVSLLLFLLLLDIVLLVLFFLLLLIMIIFVIDFSVIRMIEQFPHYCQLSQ